MAKWSGLSLDPDRNDIGLLLDHKPTVINSFQEINKTHHHHHFINHQRLTNNLDHHRHHQPRSPAGPPLGFSSSSSSVVTPAQMPMGSTVENNDIIRSSPPPPTTFQLIPVHLNCNTTREYSYHMNIHNEEMDFFATCNNKKDGDSNNIVTADTKDLTEAPSTDLDFNVNTRLHLVTGNTSSDQSIVDDGISPHSVDNKRAKCEVVVLRAELERINLENRHMKEVLNRVTNDYTNLRMHLMTMMQQQQNHQTTFGHMCEEKDKKLKVDKSNQNGMILPRQFTELGLAATTGAETVETSLSSSEDQSGHQLARITGPRSPPGNNNIDGTYNARSGSSPDKGSQGCGPNKVARLNQPSKSIDQATEATMRKARVSVRARSEAPMITDGCQWRKYGQKMAKGNPCPRAYYRCTMAAGCPVRKQVQRCAEDRSILITTYEGNHTHPLPPAAMAMASTTSSAARMLLSGSMPSADPHALINSNFLARALLPSCSTNSSNNNNIATISASAPFPTVTLDLTQNPINNNNNNNSLPFQNTFQFPPNNNNNNPVVAALLPQLLGQSLYNQSKFSGLHMSSSSSSQDNSENVHQTNHHQGVVNALATDPTFTAALAAAITSLMSNPPLQNSNNNTSSSNIIDNNNNNNNNTQNVTNTGNQKFMNSSFQASKE